MGKLIHGVNDLKTWCLENGKFGQLLIEEFTGQSFDGLYVRIDDIAYGSHKKLKWRCKKAHEWYATINNRTKSQSNCPYCLGKCVSSEKNLLIWCQNNGKWGQQLIDEWVGLDELNDPIEIDKITRASSKKVQWQCSNGHRWAETIVHRTISKRGCPYCSCNKVSSKNSLLVWCKNNSPHLLHFPTCFRRKLNIDLHVSRGSRSGSLFFVDRPDGLLFEKFSILFRTCSSK